MMNFLDPILPASFTQAFSLALLHSLWQGAAIALIALAALILMRRAKATVRYIMVYGLYLALPAAFMVTFLLVYNPGDGASVGQAASSASPGSPVQVMAEQETVMAPGEPGSRPLAWSVSSLLSSHNDWFFLCWFAGFVFFLLKFTGSLIYVNRLRNYRVTEVPVDWRAKTDLLRTRIGIGRAVRLAESALVNVPVALGYLRPLILLPVGALSSVPPSQIEAILLHELAHIYRRDYLMNLFQSLVEILFFYHPVTWWLSGIIRQEREHICDDIALSVHHDRINYIKALTTMEEMNLKSPALANALAGTKKKLLNRVRRLTHPGTLRNGMTEGVAAGILLAGFILAFSANALNMKSVREDMVVLASETTEPSRPLTAYDLSGGESGENTVNWLPEAFFEGSPVAHAEPAQPGSALPVVAEPDTIVAKSGSGRISVKVYTDSIESGDEENLKIIVERMDDRLKEWEEGKRAYEKQMIIMKRHADRLDSLNKVIIIKNGDSTILRAPNITMEFPPHRKFRYALDEDFLVIPDLPDLDDINFDFRYEYDVRDAEHMAREMEKQAREMEFKWQDFDRHYQRMDKDLREIQRRIPPPALEEIRERRMDRPNQQGSRTEKLFRQELRSDGLTIPGKGYVVELDSKSMYINGVRQPKDVYRKYRKLLESLDQATPDGGGSFKLIF